MVVGGLWPFNGRILVDKSKGSDPCVSNEDCPHCNILRAEGTTFYLFIYFISVLYTEYNNYLKKRNTKKHKIMYTATLHKLAAAHLQAPEQRSKLGFYVPFNSQGHIGTGPQNRLQKDK